MFDLNKIQSLARSAHAQELIAALVWQRQFNEFNGEEVITDLYHHRNLWASFMFSKPIFAPDERGLSFSGLVQTLITMANYRPVPENSTIYYPAYAADTLYILTENQDTVVSSLVDLGKKWRADSVEVTDGKEEDCDWLLQRRLRNSLEKSLSDEPIQTSRDAVVVSYWWD